MRLPVLLSLVFVAGVALGQRAAGTFDPEHTRVGTLQFAPNPDGGPDCAAASGQIGTDAGFSVGIGSPFVCPQTAAQANRVDACEQLAARLINGYARLQDGGL